jgi:hypothetical protein
MNSRTRLQTTLNHRQPDQVPVDFGGSPCSGIHVTCVAALREFYGLDIHPVKVIEPYQMLGEIEDDLKLALGIDIVGVGGRNTLFGFPNENWREWRLDNGLVVLVPGKFVVTEDQRGDHYIYPQGDTSASPSGRMPKDGYYFDAIIRQEPVDDDNLNPEDNLEEFKLISDADLAYMKNALQTAAKTGRGILMNPGGTGLGDIAMVPGCDMKQPKGIRDIAEWYISTVARQDYLHEVFDKQTNIAVANLDRLNQAAGDLIDAIFVCGTDFGTQTSTFCSRDTFTSLYMPYYKKVNGWIHANTGWKTLKHCCGAIDTLLDLFIEAGFDIMNPVQCSATGMDPAYLKAKYGDRLTFWGGGVDTQQVLPFGTAAEVREQVLQRCAIFARNGGYVFNSTHNVQAKTPTENIVAMIGAVKDFNGK